MVLKVPDRFSLKETVLSHGWHQLAPFRWDAASSSLWRAESLAGGSLVLLSIRQPGGVGGSLRLRLASGDPPREERRFLERRLVRMLGLDRDLSEFYRICRTESHLRYVPRAGAGRFLSAGNVFEDVFKAICATNISWNQAVRAVNRIAELGEPLGDWGFRAFPSPERVLAEGAERLSSLSRLGYRVPFLLAWAEQARAEGPEYRAADEGLLEEAALKRFFLSIRGVGPSTCHYLMMMRGAAREIPLDSSVYLFLRETRFDGRNPTPSQIRRRYERFGAWKAYAYWFEFLPWARKYWGLEGKPPRPSGKRRAETANQGRRARPGQRGGEPNRRDR